ncbi:MAG: cytochrome c3 family protein [Gemmatimonadales bacterium]
MRKLVLLGGGALVAIIAAVVLWRPSGAQTQDLGTVARTLTVADSASFKGPRQPILFRHDLHAGQFKMQCQYCHSTVAVSSEPGIPSMQTCMGCHLAIPGSDSASRVEIQKLRDAWRDRKPVEWTRVHFLPRHVHFPHSRHIQALGSTACATCHGDVARMPQVFQVNNVNNMGWCVTCHLERGVNRDCTACHF